MRDLLKDLQSDAKRDPEASARQNASRRLPKRFYEQASAVRQKTGAYAVTLDGKNVKTPAKNDLMLPTEAACRLVADEFARQEKFVDPATMPVTRLVNTAIDGVATDMQAVLEDILRFAASDLICYRAETPLRLVEIQAEAWDPILDWAQNALGAHFVLASGVIHVEQPRDTIRAIGLALRRFENPLALAAIHSMTSLTGSAILAFAAAERAFDLPRLWAAANVDEDWNISQWGEDFEARQRREFRWLEMQAADRLLTAIQA